MLNKEQTDFLLVNAYNAAVRAGARIIDIYTGDADYGVDLKSDHTPITIADQELSESDAHSAAERGGARLAVRGTP